MTAETTPAGGRRGLLVVSIATAIAGIGGYAVTTLAARGLGPHDYSVFAVFWGALYLVIGALAGFQHEFSRAAHPPRGGGERAGAVASRFVLAAAAVIATVLALVLAIASGAVFPGFGWSLALPLLCGAVVYLMVAVLTGVLYGVHAWNRLAVVIIGDVAVRAGFFIAVLALGGSIVPMAWASVVPIAVIALVLLGFVLRTRFRLDAAPRRLAANSARTLLGGASASLLVSGFPLLIGLAGGAGAEVGVLVYVLVLARAPLVVTTMALQSFLVVAFRRSGSARMAVLRVCGLIALAGAAIAVPAWFAGPWVIQLLAGDAFATEPIVPAAFVLASVTTGWLAVSGSAVLARNRHSSYAAGWVVAAVAAVLLLFLLPGDLFARIAIALAAGPAVGAAVHAVSLAHGAKERAADDRAS